MSRNFEMTISVSYAVLDGEDEEDVKTAVFEALCSQWPFTDIAAYDDVEALSEVPSRDKQITCCADGVLSGGESDDEFSDRVSEAVWKALGRAADVCVRSVFLDELPYEEFIRGEEEYAAWRNEEDASGTD